MEKLYCNPSHYIQQNNGQLQKRLHPGSHCSILLKPFLQLYIVLLNVMRRIAVQFFHREEGGLLLL